MLRTGHWISILPQDMTVSSPDLKAVPIKEKTEMMHISLLSLKGKRHSLLTEKFLEVLRQETQEIGRASGCRGKRFGFVRRETHRRRSMMRNLYIENR